MAINYNQTFLLNTGKCHRFEISDSNYLGMYTDTGIEISTLDCSSETTTIIRRSFIEMPENSPLKKYLEDLNYKSLWSMSFEDFNGLMVRPEAKVIICGMQYNSIILDYKFSPIVENTCFLAILTNFGGLTIHQDVTEAWPCVFDLTGNWLEINKKKLDDCNWLEKLFALKPAAICWQKYLNQLLLIVAFESGTIAVYMKMKNSGFDLIGTVQQELNETPGFLSSVQYEENILLVISYRNGSIRGLIFKPHNLMTENEIHFQDTKHETEPNRIYTIQNSQIYIIIQKMHQIIVKILNQHGSFVTKEKSFDQSITSVSIGGKTIYVIFSNKTIMQLSLDLTKNAEINSEKVLCSAGVVSKTGHLIFVATSHNNQIYAVTLLTKPNFEAKRQLEEIFPKEEKLTNCYDLLWLHKITMRQNAFNEELLDATLMLKLQYWELRLSLTLFKELDEKIRERVKRKLYELENCLTIETVPPAKAVCPVCGDEIISSTVRISTCRKNHSVPSCCMTRQPCKALYEATCILCHATISLQHTDDFQTIVCPLCSGYFKNLNQEIQHNTAR